MNKIAKAVAIFSTAAGVVLTGEANSHHAVAYYKADQAAQMLVSGSFSRTFSEAARANTAPLLAEADRLQEKALIETVAGGIFVGIGALTYIATLIPGRKRSSQQAPVA